MKYLIYIIPLLLVAGCSDVDRDQLFTTVGVEMTIPDTITFRRVQATLTLQEQNTGQVFVTSSFDGLSSSMEVLKGFYNVTIVGVLTYEQNGQTISKDIVNTANSTAILMRDQETYTLPWKFR